MAHPQHFECILSDRAHIDFIASRLTKHIQNDGGGIKKSKKNKYKKVIEFGFPSKKNYASFTPESDFCFKSDHFADQAFFFLCVFSSPTCSNFLLTQKQVSYFTFQFMTFANTINSDFVA